MPSCTSALHAVRCGASQHGTPIDRGVIAAYVAPSTHVLSNHMTGRPVSVWRWCVCDSARSVRRLCALLILYTRASGGAATPAGAGGRAGAARADDALVHPIRGRTIALAKRRRAARGFVTLTRRAVLDGPVRESYILYNFNDEIHLIHQ